MTQMPAVRAKIAALGATIAHDSIAPAHVAAILDEMLDETEAAAAHSHALAADTARALAALTPVRCADEDDLQARAASAPVGQQFYIPED